MNMEQTVLKENKKKLSTIASKRFQKLIQEKQRVGDVYSINYETARVLIHDYYRMKVGGIPSLSFLIATRVKPTEVEKKEVDYTLEDSSIILLRVIDAAQLPNSGEVERIRVQSAQDASGDETHWDEPEVMDAKTSDLLSFAGMQCRVIGTFFLDCDDPDNSLNIELRFGSDLSNYYPNRGLAVYKPNHDALKEIVNYQDSNRREDLRNQMRVPIGEVRYASTNRAFQGVSDVSVSISPADLLEQKTALFGMTRTGKSNTTKIIAKSVFDLRFEQTESLRIGQIIFDIDGEYANENVQDSDSALKNVWKSHSSKKQEDVVTYGIQKHKNDCGRKLMLLNFYEDGNLQQGKQIIDVCLASGDSSYITNFRQVVFEAPDSGDQSATTRYNRRVLAYRALLVRAGFDLPGNLQPNTRGLFNQELLKHMRNSGSARKKDYSSAADTFAKRDPTWEQLHIAFHHLSFFVSESNSGYTEFESWYASRPGKSGSAWADEDFKKILAMFYYQNGARLIGAARSQHTNTVTEDYADQIYEDLVKGRLVIIDQSSGEPMINQASAERIMWKIFHENQRQFREAKAPPDILIYIEEAHNLLPSGSDLNLETVWVRTAKEGAKYHLGMVYVTQEVSSIQRNILKNTANWFIGHLNNTDETRELCKFYDFADFEKSILRAQDRGFLRVKTLSNPFVVPVQIKRFEV